jgi:hypothetical protein
VYPGIITDWLLAEKDSRESISRQLKARMQTIYVNLMILGEKLEGVVLFD